MDRQSLIALLDTADKTHLVAHCTAVLKDQEVSIPDLFDISFHKRKEIAFRAAWMLEYLMVHEPERFAPHVKTLLEHLAEQQNHSAMRHYTKMVALLTAKNAHPLYLELVEATDFEPVIDVLFTRFVTPEVLVASKVHCMQALANLAPRYRWIKDDLMETIDYLTDIESIAFFARAKQVRLQLKKII
ncbi:hypothetical protein [Pedobacter deserti]|uniref:hypothetical protein n=1 Tax=Pedobacter deserti TaxID=2817382 RepID=UPI00210D7DF2|nr:hypothetical protein [Pedobacter sp. SYSU D00382]